MSSRDVRLAPPALWGVILSAMVMLLSACSSAPAVAVCRSGALGVVIEGAEGNVKVIGSSGRSFLATVGGLGDLSHASVVFSRDGRYAFVFGRDGGLTKVDLLQAKVVGRVVQAGNAIGGSISHDGSLVVVQNYDPGGIKAFDANTLELVADVPATADDGTRSKVVGLADLSGKRFIYSLFEAGEIRITDFSDPKHPVTQRFAGGKQPYDALVSPNGRYYIAGLFGEDGLALIDLWNLDKGSRKILSGYGRGEQPLPVFKMPHLRGWSIAGNRAYLPAIGRHEVLVVDTETWAEVDRIKVKSQPVFAMARPDGREIWVNFAFPDNGWVQVIDTVTGQITDTLQPGRGILHMEFLSKGHEVWLSARDDNKVVIYDTATKQPIGGFDSASPSGIFFTTRAARTGF